MAVNPAVAETTYLLVGREEGPFPTVFPYEQASDVTVYLSTATALTQLALNTDYTLGGPDPSLGGGNVQLAAGAAGLGWGHNMKLVLQRRTPLAQPSQFGEMTGFSPAASEDAIDNLARQLQDVSARVDRSIRARPGDGGMVLPSPTDRAEKVAYFDANGQLRVLPIQTLFAAIGVTILDDGVWHSADDPTTNDDGVWG